MKEQLLLPLLSATGIELALDSHPDVDDYCLVGKTIYIRLYEKSNSIDIRLKLKSFNNYQLKFV